MKKFYHGTDGKNLKTILRRGIEPRGKRQSVWGAPSCATAVYQLQADLDAHTGVKVVEREPAR